MADTRTTFTPGSPLGEVYEALRKDGVDPAAIDVGARDEFFEMAGAGDGVIDRRELLGALYERWQRYQGFIGALGFVVPWSFDDLDPATAFDARVRGAAGHLIDRAKGAVASAKVAPEDAGYTRALAEAIHDEALTDPFFLGEVEGEEVELSALEFLRERRGSCTETAKVMLGLYAMAGIPARPVSVTADEAGRWVYHAALEVEVAPGAWVVEDAAKRTFAASPRGVIPLTMAEFAGVHYAQQGAREARRLLMPWRSFDVDPDFFAFLGRARALEVLRSYYNAEGDLRPEFFLLLNLKFTGDDAGYRNEVEALLQGHPGIFSLLSEMICRNFRREPFLARFMFARVLADLARTPEELRGAHVMLAASEPNDEAEAGIVRQMFEEFGNLPGRWAFDLEWALDHE